MVGFLGAIAGGAMKGWSAGTMQEIKDKREEKLKLLDQEFTAGQNELTRQVHREDLAARERQAAAQIASTEKLTGAQLKVQQSIVEQQLKNAKSIAELGEGGANARTAAQIEAQKEIANLQIEAANVPTMIQTKTGWAWQKKDGTMMEAPIDPATNKPLDPLITKDDTPEITNFKYLAQLPGVSVADARRLAFESKNADPTVVMAGLYKANLESAGGDFSSGTTPEDRKKIEEETVKLFKNWQASVGQAGQPVPPVPTAPETTTDASTKKKSLTPAERQKAINDAKIAVRPIAEKGLGKNKAAVAKWLEDQGILPSEAGL